MLLERREITAQHLFPLHLLLELLYGASRGSVVEERVYKNGQVDDILDAVIGLINP